MARGDPRRLRDESAIPFVHNFFTRSSPGASATQGEMNHGRREELRAPRVVPRHRARRGPRDGAALHPADAEPRGDRARHLHAARTSAASTSRARCATAACRWAGCRTCGWTRAAAPIEIDFEMFIDRLTTVGANVTNLQETGRDGRVRAAARSGGGQPRDRRGVPLSRHAGESPAADGARLHAESAIHPVDADAACGDAGSAARGAGARRGDAADPEGDRRPDARQPRPGRPVLHQRRAHRPGERAAGAERRLAEVLRDDERADRGRSPRTWTD